MLLYTYEVDMIRFLEWCVAISYGIMILALGFGVGFIVVLSVMQVMS